MTRYIKKRQHAVQEALGETMEVAESVVSSIRTVRQFAQEEAVQYRATVGGLPPTPYAYTTLSPTRKSRDSHNALRRRTRWRDRHGRCHHATQASAAITHATPVVPRLP